MLGENPDVFDVALEHRCELDRLRTQFERARLDLGKIENPLDGPVEAPPGAPDRVEVLPHVLVFLSVDFIRQHVGVAEHDVQRCADLMAHVGEKFRLYPRCLQRIVARVLQLALRVLDARRHLVDALRESDELVAAFHRASGREVALRDSANRGRDLVDFLDHRSSEHRGSYESDHQQNEIGEQQSLEDDL